MIKTLLLLKYCETLCHFFFVQYNAVCGEVLAAVPTVAEGFHFKLTYPPSHAGILFVFCSTKCWKQSSENLVHTNMLALHSSCYPLSIFKAVGNSW